MLMTRRALARRARSSVHLLGEGLMVQQSQLCSTDQADDDHDDDDDEGLSIRNTLNLSTAFTSCGRLSNKSVVV